ncbi:MAG: tRNA (adenosine(37)-N6)-threonylcarbamoyltransferase complex ATPase subunit type 1 TsaE [Mesotoga infera]
MERSTEKIYELGKMNIDQLLKLAGEIGERLSGGETILLYGDLGTGKTTFVRGLARGLRIEERLVRSPTFNIINTYPGRLILVHADLYRLGNQRELLDLDLEDLGDDNTVMAIEWPEMYRPFVELPCLIVKLKHWSENERVVSLSSLDEKTDGLLSFLK